MDFEKIIKRYDELGNWNWHVYTDVYKIDD